MTSKIRWAHLMCSACSFYLPTQVYVKLRFQHPHRLFHWHNCHFFLEHVIFPPAFNQRLNIFYYPPTIQHLWQLQLQMIFIEDQLSFNLRHLCIWLRCQSEGLQHQSQYFLKSSRRGVSAHVICSVMWLKTNTSFALSSSRTTVVREGRLTYKYHCNVNIQQLDTLTIGVNMQFVICVNPNPSKWVKTTVQHPQLSCKLRSAITPLPPIWLAPRLITKQCLRVFLSRRGWGWMNEWWRLLMRDVDLTNFFKVQSFFEGRNNLH